MVESETLQFDNARTLQNLYANDFKLLQTLEEKLAVKVTTRDGWLRVEGERPNIEKTRRVFHQLEEARQHGIQIRRHEFQYALDSVTEGSRQPLGQLAGHKVLTPARRAPITPKSEQQLNYVQAIQKFDIVFGIGPAGTGKTYLAMAMGVDALRKERVKRIILTRPAVEAGEALGFLPGDLQGVVTFKQPQPSIRRECAPRTAEQAAKFTVGRGETVYDDHVERLAGPGKIPVIQTIRAGRE